MSGSIPPGSSKGGPPGLVPGARASQIDPALVAAASGQGPFARAIDGVRRWLGVGHQLQEAQPLPGNPEGLTERPNAPSQVQPPAAQPGSPGDAWFGPGTPLPPIAPREDTAGRQFDFQAGYNLGLTPRRYEGVSYQLLRMLADYDLLRLAIETRKDQLSRVDWHILPKKPPGQKFSTKPDEKCKEIQDFLMRPDGVNRWDQWVRMLAEDTLVLDAVAIYRRKTRDGRPYALEVIDGSTINILIDKTGRRPLPPAPAFQQILKGMPAAWFTSEELTYSVRNPRAHKAYGHCYSADTEILTRRGWLRFSDLLPTDEVATRNQTTKTFEWQRPTAIIAEPYSGEMYHFASRSVDLLVTPEHRMLVTAVPRALGGGAGGRWKNGGEALIAAKDLAPHLNQEIKIPMTSVWEGVEVGEKVFATGEEDRRFEVERRYADGRVQTFSRRRGAGTEKPVVISGDDYCALLGAYLAEGNVRVQGGIEIAQKDTSKGFSPYGTLIARVMAGPAQHNGRAFILPRRGLTEHFRQFGHAHEKFIPDEVINAPVRQLQLFWDHYVLGDGSSEPRPSTTGRGKNGIGVGVRIVTTSERMAGQLQEIAQKLGFSASVRRRRTAGSAVIMGRSCITRDSFTISARRSPAMAAKAVQTTYDGTIHCVSVPNRVVYVRRNGKPAWCGNSPVEQIVTYVNIGLRRMAKQLQTYTEGNIPEALMSVPETWTVEQIATYQRYWDAVMENAAARRRVKFVPAGMNYWQTHPDAQLLDQFDEWLARIVAYAFSLPPTPFVRQMNRATAESSYQTALEEGLEPMLAWLKGIIDEEIAEFLGAPGYELVWDDIRKTDVTEQHQMDLQDVQAGLKGIDEVRESRGDEPTGLPHLIWGIGPLGVISVAALKKAIEMGLDMPQPPPPPDMMGMGGMPGEDPLAGADPALLQQLGIDPGQGQAPMMGHNGGPPMQRPVNPLLAIKRAKGNPEVARALGSMGKSKVGKSPVGRKGRPSVDEGGEGGGDD